MTCSTDQPAPSRPPLAWNVKILGWASLLNDVASETMIPLMPVFLLNVLGGSNFQLGAIEGVADSTASLLKLWTGGWSDRVGHRKAFVVFGYVLAAIARPLSGLAQAPWHLFATRTSDRIGKGIRTTPRDAMIADSSPPEALGWSFGFARAMDHLGAALGPLLAMIFLEFWPDRLRLLFLLTAVPGLAVVALLVWGLRDEPPKVSVERPKFSLSLRPLNGNFRLYLLAMFVFTLGNSSDLFLLARAKALGLADYMLPVLWLVLHLVKSSGSLLAGMSVNRLGAKPLIFVGWSIYALVYLAFAFTTQLWQVWALFLVYGIYYAVTEPIEKKFVADLIPAQRKGLAYGWFNFSVGIGALPASLLFGWLDDRYGPTAAFGCGAALAGVAALLLTKVKANGECGTNVELGMGNGE